MKKTIVTIAFAISALFVNAQTFNGVEVGVRWPFDVQVTATDVLIE